MNAAFENFLTGRIEVIRKQNLYRELRQVEPLHGPEIHLGGQPMLNFSSNDYLGLARHPFLIEKAQLALRRFGTGSGASRLICGSQAPHRVLEEKIAELKGTEAALSFATGYAAALGAVCSVAGPGDVIAIDRRIHASLVDAARLSGAKLRVFRHNDLDDLDRILKWAGTRNGASRRAHVLVITESVFSMDGDLAPLRELVELKERHGAWLMVDEAHGTGVLGPRGAGLIGLTGLGPRVEIQMGTLGKAVGAAGGFIAGSQRLIDLLVNRARSFIFSTAPPPSVAAAASAGIDLIRSEEGSCRKDCLIERVRSLKAQLESNAGKDHTPIIPVILGDEQAAMLMSESLRELGIFVPAVRFPTVARGQARLRITLSAEHSDDHLRALSDALRTLRARTRQTQTSSAGRSDGAIE